MPEERYVVIDGSNIATEGRSQPSLAQLDEPVRALGWIFTTRVPVRGATSRVAVRAARQAKKADKTPDKKLTEAAAEAVAEATAEALAPKKGRRRRRGKEPSEAVNEPLAFINF